jgi:hypothetical protein
MASPDRSDLDRIIQIIDDQLKAASTHAGAGRSDLASFHTSVAISHGLVGVMGELHGLRADLAKRSDA